MKKTAKSKLKNTAPVSGKTATLDIYSLLTKDHLAVKALLKKIEKEGEKTNREEVAELFAKMRQELLAHSRAEDQVFYKPLEEDKNARDLIFESQEDHTIVENLLNRLDQKQTFDERWLSSLNVLKELILRHTRREENEVFKCAKKFFDKKMAFSIGEEFLKAKEEELGTFEEGVREDYIVEEEQMGIIQ